MKAPQNKYPKRRKIRKLSLIQLLLIIIVPIFFIGLIVGKPYAADEENSGPDIIEKQKKTEQAPLAQSDSTDPEKPIQESIEEIKTPANQEEKEMPLGKVVYLTFDDGPSKLTGQFLDVLHEQGVKATFFMQGSNLQKENLQENVKNAAKEGHYIGAHSMTHEYKTLYKENQFVPEMKETLALIHEITGTNPNLVRPPYGSAPGLNSEQIRSQIVDGGIKVWDWTIDSNDWALKNNPNQIIENIKKSTYRELEVVLMHENAQTLAALPGIIAFYREQGYEFVVYDEANHFDLNFQNDKRL